MCIGLRIKQRRESLGMTQEELATILGYKSRSTINKIEKGVSDVSQSKLFGFANALKTSPEYLLGYTTADDTNVSNCNYVDLLFNDGTSATITSNNQAFLSNIKVWVKEIGMVEYSDDEMHNLLDYAKFILSKRKWGKWVNT